METVDSRLQDAESHRADVVAAQYRRLTGESIAASDPDEMCAELHSWLQSNEEAVQAIIDKATAEFSAITLDALTALFEQAWSGETLSERDVVGATVVQQAETYETVRELFDDTAGPALWAQLTDAGTILRSEHEETLTRESVDSVLSSSTPPSPARVEKLLAEAEDPILGEDAWEQLIHLADDLSATLPNAALTEEINSRVAADDRPSETEAAELLADAEELLARARAVEESLDGVADGSIVVLDGSSE